MFTYNGLFAYLGRHGAKRVAKAVLISAVPPLMLKTEKNPGGRLGAAGLTSAKILKKATLKVHPGFPHGMPATNVDQINADLLTFFKGAATAASS
jgi:hypothetical protein